MCHRFAPGVGPRANQGNNEASGGKLKSFTQGSESFPIKANPPGSSVGFFNNENPLGYPVSTKCRLQTAEWLQNAD